MIRDYSLLGPSAKDAEEKGLAAAKWYHSDVSREDMKELMQRKDFPAIRIPWSITFYCYPQQVLEFCFGAWCIPFRSG